MDYEQTYHIGYNPNSTTRTKANALVPSARRIRRMDAKDKGRIGNPKGQTKVGTDSHVANGFLRTSFLPRLEEKDSIQACQQNRNMEKDFYDSLSQVAEHYDLVPKPTKFLGYPENICWAFCDLRELLKSKVQNWKEIRLVEHEGSSFFATEQRYDTGMTLYYIPVIPLYEMLNEPKHRQSAELLLSVCAYLYHVADIPYYRQEGSYLFSMYQMITEWKQDEENEEGIDEDYSMECSQAEDIGDFIEGKLSDLDNLNKFKSRLDTFKADNKLDDECFKLATNFFGLYSQYPSSAIHRHFSASVGLDDDEHEPIIYLDKYISFYATGNGVLSDCLFDAVNTDLQESCIIEEPVIYIPFDEREITGNDFDLEKRLFTLINDLAFLLNNYK